jgi:hypothetical protein
MTFLEGLSMLLLVGGALITFISFANRENLTGMWAAGKIDRDEQYQEAGRFQKRAYRILRWVGILAFLAGLAMMILM